MRETYECAKGAVGAVFHKSAGDIGAALECVAHRGLRAFHYAPRSAYEATTVRRTSATAAHSPKMSKTGLERETAGTTR